MNTVHDGAQPCGSAPESTCPAPGTQPLPRKGPAHPCLLGLGTLRTLGFPGSSWGSIINLGKGCRQKSVETQESRFWAAAWNLSGAQAGQQLAHLSAACSVTFEVHGTHSWYLFATAPLAEAKVACSLGPDSCHAYPPHSLGVPISTCWASPSLNPFPLHLSNICGYFKSHLYQGSFGNLFNPVWALASALRV